jgi:hypothetical protein
MLFSHSDILTVQAIIYVATFMQIKKCGFTTYHYYVALDSVLLACSTLVLIFIIAHHHYRATSPGAGASSPRSLSSPYWASSSAT